MMLPLHKGDIIKSLNLTYKNSAKGSFISQVRLVDQVSPIQAFVHHDDGTDLLSTIVATYNSAVANVAVNGSLVLMLRLNFANPADMIEIGSVEIVYQPVA